MGNAALFPYDFLHELLNINDDEDDDAVAALLEALVDVLEEEPPERLQLNINIDGWREADGVVFSENFRMSKENFNRLVVEVGHELEEGNAQELPNALRTPLDITLMMSLWILATIDTFRSTAMKFGVTKGVVFYHYVRTICALTSMAGRYIWPDQMERAHIANVFEQETAYSGCVGAIDGVHIYVTAPYEQPQRYVNRHHTFSILAQAVCDHRKLYRDVYVGEPGSVGDLQMLERSPLYDNLYRKPDMLSEGEHIVGDQAYPLSDKIQIPFPDINADERQRHHNFVLSSCRSVIERSFALLKEKFQRLRRFRSYSLPIANRHIMSCFVLHNFILLEGEPLRDDDPPNVDADIIEESEQREGL